MLPPLSRNNAPAPDDVIAELRRGKHSSIVDAARALMPGARPDFVRRQVGVIARRYALSLDDTQLRTLIVALATSADERTIAALDAYMVAVPRDQPPSVVGDAGLG